MSDLESKLMESLECEAEALYHVAGVDINGETEEELTENIQSYYSDKKDQLKSELFNDMGDEGSENAARNIVDSMIKDDVLPKVRKCLDNNHMIDEIKPSNTPEVPTQNKPTSPDRKPVKDECCKTA